MAILSPNFVSRFLKDAAPGDVLSKMQTEYGVSCMKTAEDICTIHGEWEAVNKVYAFLKEAETSVLGDGREERHAEGLERQRLEDDSDSEGPLEGTDPSDLQIVATWGNFSEESLSRMQSPSNYASNALGTVVQVLDTGGVPVKTVPGRSLLKNNLYTLNTSTPKPTIQRADLVKTAAASMQSSIQPSLSAAIAQVTTSPVAIRSKLVKSPNKPFPFRPNNKRKKPVAKKSTAKRARFTTAKKAPMKGKVDTPRIKLEPSEMDEDAQCAAKDESNASKADSDNAETTVESTDILKSEASLAVIGNDGMYHCMNCTKYFSEKKALEVHEYVYHNIDCGGKNIQCPYCQKNFLSKNGLEEHMYNHVGTRPFSCDLCNVSFNHRKSLRRHMETHQDMRRFQCPKCDTSFTRRESLDAHLLNHDLVPINSNPTGESKRVPCNLCGANFNNMGALKQHMKFKHPEDNSSLTLNPISTIKLQEKSPSKAAAKKPSLVVKLKSKRLNEKREKVLREKGSFELLKEIMETETPFGIEGVEEEDQVDVEKNETGLSSAAEDGGSAAEEDVSDGGGSGKQKDEMKVTSDADVGKDAAEGEADEGAAEEEAASEADSEAEEDRAEVSDGDAKHSDGSADDSAAVENGDLSEGKDSEAESTQDSDEDGDGEVSDDHDDEEDDEDDNEGDMEM